MLTGHEEFLVLLEKLMLSHTIHFYFTHLLMTIRIFNKYLMKTHEDLKHKSGKRYKKFQMYVITQHEVISVLRQKRKFHI